MLINILVCSFDSIPVYMSNEVEQKTCSMLKGMVQNIKTSYQNMTHLKKYHRKFLTPSPKKCCQFHTQILCPGRGGGVNIRNFEKSPEKVPESCFVGVAQIPKSY